MIGEERQTKRDKKTKQNYFDNVSIYGQSIDIKLVLKKFLESQDNFHILIENMKDMENSTSSRLLKNIYQGSLWQNIKKKLPNELVIPLIMYYDDFECGNSLGPHKTINKIGSVYYIIPTLPQHLLAQLS